MPERDENIQPSTHELVRVPLGLKNHELIPIAEGVWTEDQVRAEHSDEYKDLPRCDETRFKYLKSFPLVGVAKVEATSEEVVFSTYNTNGKEFYGTNYRSDLQEVGVDNLANPLSTNAAVITADGFLIVGGHIDGDGKGSIDGLGGYASRLPSSDSEATVDDDFNGQYSQSPVFNAGYREVIEESGIPIENITDAVMTGIDYYTNSASSPNGSCHPVVTFAMRTDLTVQQVTERHGDGEITVSFVPLANVDDHIQSLLPNVEPDGIAAFQRGVSWYKENYQ